MKKNSFWQLNAKIRLAAAAGSLFAFSITANAQLIYNGEQMLSFLDDTHDEPIYLGFGEDGDAEITLDFSDITSGPGMRMADSDGTDSFNEVVLNIPPYSRLSAVSGEVSMLAVDGKLTANITGDEWEGGEGGSFRPRSSQIATTPESIAIFNIDGYGAEWNALGWAAHFGVKGTAELNISNGGRYVGASTTIIGGFNQSDEESYGSATLTVDGEGSLFRNYSTSTQYLTVGHRGYGEMFVRNNAVVDLTYGESSEYELWVGRAANTDAGLAGDGTLTVESAGSVTVKSPFRINSSSSKRGHIIVRGEGSSFVSTGSSRSFIGNTGVQVGEAPPVGILDIEEGGYFESESSVRVGNQPGSTGIINIDGEGSEFNSDNYIQIGYDGYGSLNVTNGGIYNGRLNSGNLSSMARGELGSGEMLIEGSGSEATFARLLIGVDTSLDPYGTGSAHVKVRDGGKLTVGGLITVGNGNTIELEDGTIEMVPTVGSRPDVISMIHEGTAITGQGTILSDVTMQQGAKISGTGDGIEIDGTLFAGIAENVLLADVEIAPATLEGEERKGSGPVTLNDARFKSGSIVNITINDESFAPLLTFDGETDFSEAGLMIEFSPFEPETDWYARIFRSTGDSNHEPNFGWDALPGEWIITNGILHHESVSPPEDESPYLEWADQFELSEADADPDASLAGDGFTNLEKFAFGLNPTIPVPALVQLSGTEDELILRWNRSTNPGVSYEIERKVYLDDEWFGNFGGFPIVMSEPDITPPSGYERVEFRHSTAEYESLFFRVLSNVNPDLLP